MNKNKIIVFIVICLLFGDIQSAQTLNENKTDLQIYLPREISIQESTLKLGYVGIVRGTDSFIKKANQINLGRFSMPGQEIVISKHTIMSRLASEGISVSDVTFMGAEEVNIRRKQQIITGDDFTKLADNFLKKNITDNSISGWKPIRAAQELIIPDSGEDVKYSYKLEKSINSGYVSLRIEVSSGDQKIGSRSITFRLEYENRTPVALTNIPVGTVITSENIKIEKRPSYSPEPLDWKSPYGLVAKRVIQANTVIRNDMIGTVKPEVIIKRNQNVVIRIVRPGFTISAVGKTMQDGRVGECIKVKNVDSQTIIIAKVNEDGSVEPM
ncbi:MAG: flagellar basal body P-ring formation protein FlgA [Sedimentisphaerales bacterium]|nr:flagellar basal body P-ring formation protein FlgA [Sedimentisphaerales bacterium]